MDARLASLFEPSGRKDDNNKEIQDTSPLRPEVQYKTNQEPTLDRPSVLNRPDAGPTFFALARALWLRGQDAPLALALIAWGQEHATDAVNAIASRLDDPEWIRRCLGGLARKMAKNAPEAFHWHSADDPETLKILTPYIEKQPTPEWMTWADQHVAYRLDKHDLAVIDHIRTSDQRERAAIQWEAAGTSPSGSRPPAMAGA